MRRLIGILAVVLFTGGCGHNLDDCRNAKTCPSPPNTVSDAGAHCNGLCVPAVVYSNGWSPLPFLLWRGTANEAATVDCPDEAPTRSQPYYASPDQTPMSCPACACEPSTGACALPEIVAVGASSTCPSEAGDAGVPFDPPSGWDGGCTASESTAAADCDGGLCQVTIGPVAPINAACAPTQAVVTKSITWTNTAFACVGGTNNGACEDPGTVCAPAPSTLPPGFSVCVSYDGDDSIVLCPAGYPLRSVYYLGGEDDRGCAACECGPPQGDSCSSSLVSLYSDDACAVLAASVLTMPANPVCVSGTPLGSKQASAPIYTPGTCQPSGGEPTGSVEPKHPVTICCRQ
jgi:hypothetical protein